MVLYESRLSPRYRVVKILICADSDLLLQAAAMTLEPAGHQVASEPGSVRAGRRDGGSDGAADRPGSRAAGGGAAARPRLRWPGPAARRRRRRGAGGAGQGAPARRLGRALAARGAAGPAAGRARPEAQGADRRRLGDRGPPAGAGPRGQGVRDPVRAGRREGHLDHPEARHPAGSDPARHQHAQGGRRPSSASS